jgi:tetratricopeptide (TPR) repeat protein
VVGAFVGRKAEVERVRSALGAGLVLLTGEAGIGKTRLAERIAEEHARVSWGRCWETGGAPPYWPWIEILGDLGADPFAHADTSAGGAGRMKLMSDVLAVLRAVPDPLLVVLDDLHAADVPSLTLLHFVARRLSGAKVSILATSRETLPPETADLHAKIAREAEVIPLARLALDEVAVLAKGSRLGPEEVHRVSEGNPFFVLEILRRGAATPLPHGLRALLDEHLSRLSPDAHELLRAASVLGRSFSAADLAFVSAKEPDAIFGLLREAGESNVVGQDDDRWTFTHMLFCERLAGDLTPSKRGELHARAGEAHLERHEIVQAAHHLLEGSGDDVRAATVARTAFDVLMAKLAFEDAAKLAERARKRVDPKHPLACDLSIAHGEALIRYGEGARGREACVLAASQAKTLGDPVLRARAAMAYASEFSSGRVDPVMVELLRGALDALPAGDTPLRARAMARLAAAMVPPTNDTVDDVLSLAESARQMARRIGDPETLLYVLYFAGSADGYLVPAAKRHGALEELITLATALDRPVILVQALSYRVVVSLEQGRRTEAETALEACAKLIDEFPPAHYRWRALGLRALFALLDGDFDRADRLADEIADTGSEAAQKILGEGLLRIGIAYGRGRPEAIAPHAQRLLRAFGAMPTLAPWTAWILAAIGRKDEARDMLKVVASQPESFPWLITAGDTAVMIGDRALAEPIYAMLSQQRFRNRAFWGPAGMTVFGPTSRVLGDLATLLGKTDEADGLYREAYELCERMGARALAAACKVKPRAPEPSSPVKLDLVREGDTWRLTSSAGATVRLKDSKGVAYLKALLSRAGEEIHVADLAGIDDSGDAGPMLDAKAKDAYRRELEDAQDALAEAEELGDPGRASRARARIDAIAEELARGVGLGGRDRRAASNVERARINVQRRLKDVIERVREHDERLAKYLDSTIKTGAFCSFQPL